MSKQSKSKHGHSASSISGFKPKTTDSNSQQIPKDESGKRYEEYKKAMNKKDYDKALEYLDKAIEANPGKKHYYARKVEVLAEMKQTTKANETLEKININKSSITSEDKLTNRILERVEKKHPELFLDHKNNNNLEISEAKESKETKHLSSLKKLIEGRNKSNSSDEYKKLKEENEQLKQKIKQLEEENAYNKKIIIDIKNMVIACDSKTESSTNNDNNYGTNTENKEESTDLGGKVQDTLD